MTTELPDILRLWLSEFVAQHLGLHFPKERWDDLERGVRAAAQESGSQPVDAYVQRLLSSNAQSPVEILATHLTVGETYFFREQSSFDFLREEIIPKVTSPRCTRVRRLRVWSAGCATGEEPYSVAILLSRSMPDFEGCSISILATDVNARSVEKAVAGTYGKWSFRTTPDSIRSAYFTAAADDRWTVVPAVKQMVTFARLNLAMDHYLFPFNSANAFDVILCRNVLMYFTPEAAKKVIRRLYGALAPGGWLMVGAAEASHVLFSELGPVDFLNGAAYKKPDRDLTKDASYCLHGQNHAAPGMSTDR